MYYKEEWINGKLYWKGTPEGEWVEMTKAQYAERLLESVRNRQSKPVEEVDKWISVKDGLPEKKSKVYICWDSELEDIIVYYFDSEGRFYNIDKDENRTNFVTCYQSPTYPTIEMRATPPKGDNKL